jgi:hypothetical protein
VSINHKKTGGGGLFADQIIQDLSDHKKFLGQACSLYGDDDLKRKIRYSKKFFCGYVDSIKSHTGLPYNKMFNDDEYILPYKICLFAWKITPVKESGKLESSKRSVLAYGGKRTWQAMVFYYIDELKEWHTYGIWHHISPGRQWEEKDLRGFNLSRGDSNLKTHIMPLPTPFSQSMLDIAGDVFMQEALTEDLADLNVVQTILKLLHCKNIRTSKVEPSQKLNKKRVKKGKEPAYSYEILNIIRLGITSGDPYGENNEGNTRLHLCRGHFKEYTDDRPLFGKHTGRYWWEPQVRGKLKNGLVEKDYNICT